MDDDCAILQGSRLEFCVRRDERNAGGISCYDRLIIKWYAVERRICSGDGAASSKRGRDAQGLPAVGGIEAG